MMESCYHGGAFWEALGPRFDRLSQRNRVISADVLDAWFPPSPEVVEALSADIEWIARTSPPTHCDGLIEAIAQTYSLRPSTLAVGSGSSALIYAALRQWLDHNSRVLLIEPTYGEYAHVCQNVIGCQVETLRLSPSSGFRMDTDEWLTRLEEDEFDLAVLVNPNNPTGVGIDAESLTRLLGKAPKRTRVLVDEAYIDYTDLGSVQSFAPATENVFVVKSLSKCFALSGIRVAYMCGNPEDIGTLRRWTPPWAVSLPAQIAAIRALGSLPYYQARYRETNSLREDLKERLCALGFPCFGAANWLMIQAGDADRIVSDASKAGTFLRNAGRSAPSLGNNWIRTAVKTREENERIISCFEEARCLAALRR